jgi:hypothetical protein
MKAGYLLYISLPFLLKLNHAVLITVCNMPIFYILKGQIYEGGGVREYAITL